MVTKQIDVKEAQVRVQELLSQIASGVEWILTDGMTPVARLVPISSRVPGLHTGAIRASPDFDEPLPEEFWTDNVGVMQASQDIWSRWLLNRRLGGDPQHIQTVC
jgi:antitoxin (DNA-binding transcriptional repressor) of toxin-antitoxin stability system